MMDVNCTVNQMLKMIYHIYLILFIAYTVFFYKLIDFHKIKQNPQRTNNNLLDILHRKERPESKIISTI